MHIEHIECSPVVALLLVQTLYKKYNIFAMAFNGDAILSEETVVHTKDIHDRLLELEQERERLDNIEPWDFAIMDEFKEKQDKLFGCRDMRIVIPEKEDAVIFKLTITEKTLQQIKELCCNTFKPEQFNEQLEKILP